MIVMKKNSANGLDDSNPLARLAQHLERLRLGRARRLVGTHLVLERDHRRAGDEDPLDALRAQPKLRTSRVAGGGVSVGELAAV